MGMMLTYRPGYWEGAPAEPVESNPEADAYDDLSDEQVAEAYATNVGGNATSRKGQLRALRKLDDESSE